MGPQPLNIGQDLWGNNKRPNICIIGVQKREGKAEIVFREMVAENGPNLLKDTNLYIQEAE